VRRRRLRDRFMALLLASVPAHREQRQPEGVRDVILGELDTGGWPHQPERPDPQSQKPARRPPERYPSTTPVMGGAVVNNRKRIDMTDSRPK
jgi:hypothetical protein